MTVVLELAVSIAAAVSILFAFYFAWKAITSRSRTSHETYNVGQQQARQAARINFVWSLVLLVVGLILLGISGLGFGLVEADQSLMAPTDTPVPLLPTETDIPATAVTPTIFSTATLAPLATMDLGITPQPTAVIVPPASPTAPIEPSPTPTNSPPTAVVSSGVGVWLRAAPSTSADQIEWLQDGIIVVLLAGRQQADGMEWQQIRTPNGQEGWSAAEFLLFNEN